MIVRLSHALARKIGESDFSFLPSHPNPFADWSARLFTADRVQYLIITNTAFLYSVVTYGKGITSASALLVRMTEVIREVMEHDGFGPTHETCVAPETAQVFFAKALSRSVTGSMNDLIFQAKWHLAEGDLSPYDVSFLLNEILMSYLKYRTPRHALEDLAGEITDETP